MRKWGHDCPYIMVSIMYQHATNMYINTNKNIIINSWIRWTGDKNVKNIIVLNFYFLNSKFHLVTRLLDVRKNVWRPAYNRLNPLMFWCWTLHQTVLANNISKNNNSWDAINGRKLTLLCFKLYKDILTLDITTWRDLLTLRIPPERLMMLLSRKLIPQL